MASNSFECTKSLVLAKMISGRYRTQKLSRFWTGNKNGYCLASTCHETVEDLEHVLAICPALEPVRSRLWTLFVAKTEEIPNLQSLIYSILGATSQTKAQFILDPMMFPDILNLLSIYGQPLLDHIYYLTRTFAYYIHRQRQLLLGNWPGDKMTRQKLYNDKSKTTNLTNSSLLSGLPEPEPLPVTAQHSVQQIAGLCPQDLDKSAIFGPVITSSDINFMEMHGQHVSLTSQLSLVCGGAFAGGGQCGRGGRASYPEVVS